METVSELNAIVGLDTGDREWEEAHHLFEELDGIVAAKLIEDHLKLHAAVLVNSRVLIEFLTCQSARETFLGYIFHIHLNALATALHTLIRLWQASFALGLCGAIFAQPAQCTEQRASRTSITMVLYEMNVKHIQAHLFILARNPPYQPILFRRMFPWVVMWPTALLFE